MTEDQPKRKLSTFIVAYKKPDFTNRAIQTFRDTGGGEIGKLTVLDNSPEKLALNGADEHYHFPWNPSLTRVWNWALCLSKTEWTLICNSDVVFRSNWTVLFQSEHMESSALVHNKFYAFFIRKAALAKVGFFDERFTSGYWEDCDYVRRLLLSGHQWCESCFSSLIEHDHQYTHPRYDAGANQDWYKAKWGDLRGDSEFRGLSKEELRGSYNLHEPIWYPAIRNREVVSNA